jgi:sulfur carrier protein ThiS
MAVIVNFSLDPDKDKDLLKWLGRQTNRSAAIRSALRSYMAETEGVTLADVLAEVRALPSRMSVVAVNSEPEPVGEGEEPEEAAANLNGLLDRLGNGDLG